jgi:hypothetical protein
MQFLAQNSTWIIINFNSFINYFKWYDLIMVGEAEKQAQNSFCQRPNNTELNSCEVTLNSGQHISYNFSHLHP